MSNNIINYSKFLSIPVSSVSSYQLILPTFDRYAWMYSLQKMIGLKLCLSAQLAILSLLGNLNKTHYIHEKVQLYGLYHIRLKWIKSSLLNCLISCMACRSHNTVFYTMANSLFTIGNSTAAAVLTSSR